MVVLENGISIFCVYYVDIYKEVDYVIGVYVFFDVEFVVFEVGNNFFGEILSVFFESSNLVGVGFLELRFDGFYVVFKVGKVRLWLVVSVLFVCVEL